MAKLLAWPCSMVQRSDSSKRIGSATYQRYMPTRPRYSGLSTRWKPRVRAGVLALDAGAGAEDLLVAGAVDAGRPGVAVDEHHVVALAVPTAGDVVDLQHQADHLALPPWRRAPRSSRRRRGWCRRGAGCRAAPWPGPSVAPGGTGRGTAGRPAGGGLSKVSYSTWYQTMPSGPAEGGVGPVLDLDAGAAGERHREVGVHARRCAHARVHGGEEAARTRGCGRGSRRRSRRAAPRPTASPRRPTSTAGSRPGGRSARSAASAT